MNVALYGRGRGAYAELSTVLGYVGARIVGSACVDLYLAHAAVEPDGTVADREFTAGVRAVLSALAGQGA